MASKQAADPWRPVVSVVVPVLNEERALDACLRSLTTQTYPPDLVEILVLDGGCTDGSVAVAEGYASAGARIRILDNPRRITAAALNIGIRNAVGDVIPMISAHSEVPPTYIANCVRILSESGADCVGGRMMPVGDTTVQRAIAAAMCSPLGVGGSQFHYADTEMDVATVYPMCIRRSAFDRVGLYDESLAVHEDYELNWRIRASGGRVRFSPDIWATYHVRRDLRSLARQYFRYGRGKASVARRNWGVMRPYHAVPPAMVLATATLGAFAPLSRSPRLALTGLLGGYALVIALGSISTARSLNQGRGWLPATFATMHWTWGAGFLYGLIAGPEVRPAVTRPAAE